MAQKSVFTKRYARFLDLIISARHEAGLTQQGLAAQLNRPQSYVSKYERAERRLDVLEFVDIADTLNIDPCPLIESLRDRGED